MSAPRRMLICEEALKNYNGHWFEYNKAVVEMNRAEGVEVEVLAHRGVEPAIRDALGAKPYFQWTNWDQIYYHPAAWRRYLGILVHNWRVYQSVSRHLKRSEPYDLVFVPTVVIFHLIAWWFLAWRFGGRKINRIVLLIRNSAATYEDEGGGPSFSKSSGILRFVLKGYRKLLARKRVRFASDSHRLANEYRQLSGIEFVVAPHPCLLMQPASAAPERDLAGPITFSLPGPARWEKGLHVLIDALRILKAENIPPLRIVLQWPDDVFSPEGEQLNFEASEFEQSQIEVEAIHQPLSSTAYEQLLTNSDAIVLPYTRQAYFARISGVAVEAMLLGIPVIYTNDTWNSDMVEKYGAGIGFANESAEDLAGAILSMMKRLDTFRKAARDRAPNARAHFSAASFQRSLWEL